MPNLSRHRKRKHAIVVGGSMAGLLATRVFADYFEQVTTVERDRFPAMGEQRRGVPQGRHTHGLLASGRRILDELFPQDSMAVCGKHNLGLLFGGSSSIPCGMAAKSLFARTKTAPIDIQFQREPST